MKNKDTFEIAILNAAALVKQGRLDEVLLMAYRNRFCDQDRLSCLFCDCCGTECESDDCCSDEAILSCIRRFLERDMPEE